MHHLISGVTHPNQEATLADAMKTGRPQGGVVLPSTRKAPMLPRKNVISHLGSPMSWVCVLHMHAHAHACILLCTRSANHIFLINGHVNYGRCCSSRRTGSYLSCPTGAGAQFAQRLPTIAVISAHCNSNNVDVIFLGVYRN